MMIDLSFTKDEEWITERKKIWNKWSPRLEKTLTPQQLSVVEKYFMTGQESAEYKLSDGALLDYFPLQTAEGWDYVFENYIVKESEYRDFLNESLQDRSDIELFPHKVSSELERWDYFFGEEFEPVIKSRVPVGREQKVIELELDPFDIFRRIAPGITGFLEKGLSGDWPKWVERQDYFWSLWQYVDDNCFDEEDDYTTRGDVAHYCRRLMNSVVSIDKDEDYEDLCGTRSKFISMMEKKIDSMYEALCPKLRKLWDEVKAKKDS